MSIAQTKKRIDELEAEAKGIMEARRTVPGQNTLTQDEIDRLNDIAKRVQSLYHLALNQLIDNEIERAIQDEQRDQTQETTGV